MSGSGLLRIKLADGSEYEMPEAEAFPAMQDLEKRGIKFDATESPAREAPAIDPSTQPDAPPSDGASSASPWRDLYNRMTQQGPYETAFLSDLRKAQPNSGWENLDKTAASLVSPLALEGSAAGGVVGGLSRIGASTLNQGTSGALSGGFNAAIEGKDAEDVAKDAAIGGGLGAGLGAAGGAVGELGRGASKLGELIGEGADKARLYAAGLGDEGVAAAFAKRLGISAVPKDLAALVERITPSKAGGMSATERAAELGGELNSIGGHVERLDAKADAEGVNQLIPDSWAAIAERLGIKAKGAPSATGAERAYKNVLGENAAQVAEEAAPQTMGAYRARKSDWQGEGHTGMQGGVPDRASAQAAADQGRIAKEEFDALYGYALPETQLESRMLNRDYQTRAALKEAAEGVGSEASPGWLPRVGGAALGGAAGYFLSPEGYTPAGVIAGAAGGARAGVNAAARFAGTRGADYWANIGRLLERRLPEIGNDIGALGDAAGNVGTREAVGLEDLLRRQREEEEGIY